MTALLYIKDYIKTKLKAESVKFYVMLLENCQQIQFDEENPTHEEEILQEGLETVLIKCKNPQFTSSDLNIPESETMYVNSKNQLIKITPMERNGKMTELHQILSFDVEKLPQAKDHNYGAIEDTKDGESTPKFNSGGLVQLPRAKVPVKDGMSQNKFMQQSKMKAGLVENPNDIFYTAEEVAQHNNEQDCWTVFNGRVYDITQYAKVHPGGKKIFLGKGKDCTDLYNKYHPWVNAVFLIGKYQVGVLKR